MDMKSQPSSIPLHCFRQGCWSGGFRTTRGRFLPLQIWHGEAVESCQGYAIFRRLSADRGSSNIVLEREDKDDVKTTTEATSSLSSTMRCSSPSVVSGIMSGGSSSTLGASRVFLGEKQKNPHLLIAPQSAAPGASLRKWMRAKRDWSEGVYQHYGLGEAATVDIVRPAGYCPPEETGSRANRIASPNYDHGEAVATSLREQKARDVTSFTEATWMADGTSSSIDLDASSSLGRRRFNTRKGNIFGSESPEPVLSLLKQKRPARFLHLKNTGDASKAKTAQSKSSAKKRPSTASSSSFNRSKPAVQDQQRASRSVVISGGRKTEPGVTPSQIFRHSPEELFADAAGFGGSARDVARQKTREVAPKANRQNAISYEEQRHAYNTGAAFLPRAREIDKDVDGREKVLPDRVYSEFHGGQSRFSSDRIAAPVTQANMPPFASRYSEDAPRPRLETVRPKVASAARVFGELAASSSSDEDNYSSRTPGTGPGVSRIGGEKSNTRKKNSKTGRTIGNQSKARYETILSDGTYFFLEQWIPTAEENALIGRTRAKTAST
ncbi:unnamed protein product [Amoebophrya sp. A25]|nr:unnamed protein product [Amoebophrya sp. A25]|eukprot:GSA25T00016153001.1